MWCFVVVNDDAMRTEWRIGRLLPAIVCVLAQVGAWGQGSGTRPAATQQREVPVLCYHQVRDWTAEDAKSDRVYITPIATFIAQMQLLHDSGYTTILPDALVAHLAHGAPLPARPVLITFDDATRSQYLYALPELERWGFRAAFFVMTVSMGHERFMTREQVTALARKGHAIGCHTWDHHNVTRYTATDWARQVEGPRRELEKLAGRPVQYFAYPNGLWDTAAVDRLRQYGFGAAFQLWGRMDQRAPLYTIRRVLVSGYWSREEFVEALHRAER